VKRDGDGGESLLETMFAVVMLGLLVVTAVMAFTSVINEAIQYRMLASINVILHNDVSEATTQLQNQANPLYATCATPATYSPSGTNAVTFPNQMAGYSSTITAVTYWDGSSFAATCPPIVDEPQPQQLTVRVTSADGVLSDSSQFTVDNPYSSSQYPPDLALAQLAFVQQPTTIYSLQTFSPSVQVAVEDANGNVLTSDWSNVTMTVTPIARTNGGSLAACTGTEDQGVFTFPTCTLDGGGQYELVATDQGITATSIMFNAITQLDPPVVTAAAGSASQLGAVIINYIPSDNAPSDQAYTGYACLDPQLQSDCTLVTPFASGDTIPGLQSGQVYYVAVEANASQDYLEAESLTTSPVAATLQNQTPVITSVTGAGGLTVTFTDATIAPSPTYSVTACTDQAMSQDCVTVPSFTSGSTITGETLGTSYYVTVAIASQPGWLGVISAPYGPTTVVPATVPGPPTSVSGASGNVQATISWLAPTSNGGSPITTYTVTSSPGGLTCTTATLSCVVTGLTNGSSYTFTVTATNAVGTGPASAPSPAVTLAATVPGALTVVVGVTGNAEVTLSWLAPASNGGSAITSYTVTSSPGGFTCTTATLSCTVTGLTNGSSYTFTVTATNAVGTGPASAPSPAVTPAATVPGAPTGLSATGSTSSLTATLNWLAPASNGGALITGYDIEYSQSSSTGPWTTATTASSATSFTLTLASTTTFYWQVGAINALGQSTWSSVDTVTWSVTGSYGYSYPIYGYVQVYEQTGTVYEQTGTTQVYEQTGSVYGCTNYTYYGSTLSCIAWGYTPVYGYVTVPVYGYVPTYGYVQVYEQTGTGYGTGYYYGWRG
jgi:hypothetical protein